MRASQPSKRGNMPWQKSAFDIHRAALLFEGFGYGIVEGEPSEAFLWRDAQGNGRCLIATWSDSQRIQANFNLDGTPQSLRWLPRRKPEARS